jgi:hypothetical protein
MGERTAEGILMNVAGEFIVRSGIK